MTRRRRKRAGEDADDPTRALEKQLISLYREVDALYAGYRCPSSTACCRFAVTGREPYVTSIELSLLKRAIAARGGPLKDKRRALPLAADQSRDQERTCPLLDASARCSVYQARPLGCRSFWCDRAESDAPVKQPALNALVRRLQDIAARHQPDGDRGRPLTRALDELGTKRR